MKRMNRLFLAVVLFALPSVGYGQASEIKFEEYTLKNGLHVILHQNNSSPVVAINITYHVGSKNENPDRTGFAHFFEHLMFEGSENIKRGDFDNYVNNAGGVNNAGTSFDYTTYYEILPSNQLALGLWLESERMLHLKIDSVGVETQRNVVKEERRSRFENQPYGSFIEEIFSRAFTVSPYRWIPIGSVQYIDQATLGEFMQFHDDFYKPNNAVLVIAGDINTTETLALVKKYFEDIPTGIKEVYRPHITEPELGKEIRDTVYDNIQLPATILTYHMPSVKSQDYYALDMLQTLLSGGNSSRLNKKLVDEEQLAVGVQSFPFALEDAGLFLILGIANLGIDASAVEAAIEKEIDLVKTQTISDVEFQKLKNSIENRVVSSNSTMEGIASSLGEYYTMFNDPNRINKELEYYSSVTPEDLKRVANTYLTKDSRVVLYYLPKSAQK